MVRKRYNRAHIMLCNKNNTSVGGLMKFIVKAFDQNGKEIKFENTVIGEGKEVTFETLEAAQAFIEGIRISLPCTFQYKVIQKKAKQERHTGPKLLQ